VRSIVTMRQSRVPISSSSLLDVAASSLLDPLRTYRILRMSATGFG
jgi:hypothetical protein